MDGSDAGGGSGQESRAKRVREDCLLPKFDGFGLLLLLAAAGAAAGAAGAAAAAAAIVSFFVYRTYCCAYTAVLMVVSRTAAAERSGLGCENMTMTTSLAHPFRISDKTADVFQLFTE